MNETIQCLELSSAAEYFKIEKAEYQRDWMEAYGHGFAYRCLPMKVANQSGWVIKSPIGFDAVYNEGKSYLESVSFKFDEPNHPANNLFSSHFGRGVITLAMPYIFRTNKDISLWVRGLPNYYKNNISFLEGIVETFWLEVTFTYNIRIIRPNEPVRFEKGEPLLFFTLYNLNPLINVETIIEPVSKYPDIVKKYNKWSEDRIVFNKNPSRGPMDWQKDYFVGKKSDGTNEETHIVNSCPHGFIKKDLTN